jgi:hypothetical protein
MNIKEFYLKNYPHDELGSDINESANFVGLLNVLYTDGNVYDYIGVHDSIMREYIFEELSDILDVDYGYVFDLWINEVKTHYNHTI